MNATRDIDVTIPSVRPSVCRFWTRYWYCQNGKTYRRNSFTAGYDTTRYDTIGEFNVDWKAEYSALSRMDGFVGSGTY